ncbi:heat-inducible transcriptional repressor HrcA [Candidatus Protochlamydia amoebophila]|uniref:heat-inducible transcriptional repressor HrcA n=1 Tax=Candidatus Protochlamydia amoebophila TaxID=362787 RepID=UPI00057E3C25|nr:heat-inducible transcriptional repressor HrcA [Candidatus Protochlamydia amoebophila]
MKIIKPTPIKRVGKHDRERRVLLGLVDYYIQTGKPVGSNTLKEAGFEDLSSATIRNYFAQLEEEGYLLQSHSSGGRIPTDLAYRIYAHAYLNTNEPYPKQNPFEAFKSFESKEIAIFLQEAAEKLSWETNCAVFLSAPRFDHDFIANLKLVPLDAYRCLCIIMTDFGVIKTEVMHLPVKLSSFGIKRIENYFHCRLTNLGEPENLEPEEETIAQTFYNELMLRYIVGYSNFIDVDLYRTGFSRLLFYSDFQDTNLLASSLSLFENAHSMRLLLKECKALNHLRFWIGDDLSSFANSSPRCSVLTIPYYINYKPVGAVGLLGPTRLPYRALFSLLKLFSDCISETVTKNVYKFKIDYRQPEQSLYLKKEESLLIGQSRFLIEDKRP